ncbi:MAG: DUF6174 domain-containing protein, partial [Thiofilum sp.]
IIVPATSGNDTVAIPTPSFNPSQNIPMDNKTYWGGAGQDTAVLSGKLSDYSISSQPDGTIMISPFDGQPVTIKDFESFRFADISLTKEQLLDPAQTLNYRRQQWQAQGLSNYSLSVSKYTNNAMEGIPVAMADSISSGPVGGYENAQLDVVNGRVVKASSYDLNNPTVSPELANLTVDALFDLAQKALDRGEKVEINYDQRGVPNNVRIGNINYSAYLQANLIAGTAGDDTLNAQFTPYPTTPTIGLEQILPSRYWGDAGNDTLAINGRLRDFMVNRNPNSDTFDIYANDGNKTSVSTVDIERLQFSDVSIDTAQYKPQLLNYYQQQWNSAPLQDYTLELTKSKAPVYNPADSFIAPVLSDNFERATLEVKNGQIVSVTATDSMGNPTTPSAELANLTVDKLFTIAQQALATNAKTEINYDSRKAYPQSIQIPTDGSNTYYSAYVRVPGEPDIMPVPYYASGASVGRGGVTGIGGWASSSTAILVPTPAPAPSVTTTSGTTSSTPVPQPVTTTSTISTPVTTTSGVSNTSPTIQDDGRIKIDQQVLIRLLMALIQLLKTMQANNESHNQNTVTHTNTVNNIFTRRVRN